MSTIRKTEMTQPAEAERALVPMHERPRGIRLVYRFLHSRPWLVTILSLIVTFSVWEWYGRSVDPLFFSSPSAIVRAVPDMVSSGQLPDALGNSCEALFIGFACAIVVGILIGLLTGRYRLVSAALN